MYVLSSVFQHAKEGGGGRQLLKDEVLQRIFITNTDRRKISPRQSLKQGRDKSAGDKFSQRDLRWLWSDSAKSWTTRGSRLDVGPSPCLFGEKKKKIGKVSESSEVSVYQERRFVQQYGESMDELRERDRETERQRAMYSGALNHVYGAVLLGCLWPIILLCLALSPHLA